MFEFDVDVESKREVVRRGEAGVEGRGVEGMDTEVVEGRQGEEDRTISRGGLP